MATGLVTLRFERATARTMTGQHAFATDPGRRRSTNQDQAFAERLPDGRTLLVVADGVGGMAGGELASEETLRVVLDEMHALIGGEPEQLLRAAVRAANQRVRDLREQDVNVSGMATTLVIALVGNGEAWIANLGDSRAYLYDGGELRQVTQDDSLVAEQVRLGIITEAEAAESPRQNVITRGIGVEETLDDEVVEYVLIGPGGMLMLCSDGLYRAVPSEEIAAILDMANPRRVVPLLVDRANAAGGPDNIGIAVYRRDVDTPTEDGEATILDLQPTG